LAVNAELRQCASDGNVMGDLNAIGIQRYTAHVAILQKTVIVRRKNTVNLKSGFEVVSHEEIDE
jgi:hypothetical protein